MLLTDIYLLSFQHYYCTLNGSYAVHRNLQLYWYVQLSVRQLARPYTGRVLVTVGVVGVLITVLDGSASSSIRVNIRAKT